jgi:plastocyanin
MRATNLSALLLLFALPCAAADHLVFVFDGGYDPPALTIAPGDTVTWKATGNAAPHNVHADDDSFRCATTCSGTGGDPKKEWTITVPFTNVGKTFYHCDEHPVMIGSITVNAVAATTPVGPGFSGNWYDPTPNKGGHGFQIEILPNNGMLAIWFVFNPAGSAQNWIYSQGIYDPTSSTATLPAFLEQGGSFPPNFDATKLNVTEWGTLQFNFTDCNNGSVSWKSNAASAAAGYADTSFPIQRLTSIAGMTCP